MRSTFACFVIAFAVASSAQSQESSAKLKLFRHHATTVWECNSPAVKAFVYKSGLAIDADGAYRAYHPNNHLGLDTIEHAGHPGNWWALATDNGKPSGHPVVQRKNDPAPGYYVSMTALFDPNIPDEHNPRRFVDAATIPYVVLPPEGFHFAKLGDFATVVNLRNGRVSGAIVGDESAPDLVMGEGSIALANTLGVDSNARIGGIEHGIAYVIYRGSGNRRPRGVQEIKSSSQERFQMWGGLQKLDSCLN